MIAAQGGDPGIIDDPSKLPQAPHREEVTAGVAGQLKRVDAQAVARAGHVVGVGRERADQDVDPAVGVEWLVEPGQMLTEDSVIARLHWRGARP